jgi:hypothetical protein
MILEEGGRGRRNGLTIRFNGAVMSTYRSLQHLQQHKQPMICMLCNHRLFC